MSFSYFISKRIYKEEDGKKSFSRPASRIAICGVAIGVSVMIISLCISIGFKKEISDKIIGFGSHIQVLSLTYNQDFEMLPVISNDSLLTEIKDINGVENISVYASRMGMLKNDDNFTALTFKGVSPDYNLNFYSNNLIEGEIPDFSTENNSNCILISKTTALEMNLSINDKVYAYFISGSTLRARRFTVSGIFETNLSDYDKTTAIADISTIRKLNKWEGDYSSGLEIEIENFKDAEQVKQEISKLINDKTDLNGAAYGAFTIKELAPAMFGWLGVLDMNLIIILVLMIFVSSFTVISGLLIIMLERINMIGVLKALGASNRTIRSVFIKYSFIIIGRGLIIGNLIGIIASYIQNKFNLIELDPSVYYINRVPIEFDWFYILVINISCLLTTLLIVIIASHFVSLQKPVKTIEFN